MVQDQGSPAVGWAAGPEAMGQPAGRWAVGPEASRRWAVGWTAGSEAMGSEASDLFTLVRCAVDSGTLECPRCRGCRDPTLNE